MNKSQKQANQKTNDNTSKKSNVALSSVFVSALLTILKLIVGLLTGSMGILSEAAHSLLDFIAAIITYLAVKVSDRPSDRDHHFGHGKVENISALIETGLLFITSGWILYEAIHRLFIPKLEVETTWYSFAIIILAIVMDYSRSRALKKVAIETKSQALDADALHFSSDILSSFAVLVGLIFVHFGFEKADSIAAIIVALFVIQAGWNLGKKTYDVLTDAASFEITEQVEKIIEIEPGVLGYKRLRIRPSGPTIFIDCIVLVNRLNSSENIQKISNNLEASIQNKFPESDISIITKPISLESENILEKIKAIATNLNLSVYNIIIYEINGKKDLSLEMEVEYHLTVHEAHEKASQLEKQILTELETNDISINIHIEPLFPNILSANNINKEQTNKITILLNQIKDEFPLIKDLHNINIKDIDNKYFIVAHALFDENISLESAHNEISDFEHSARHKIPNLQKILIHIEPLS